MRKRDSDRLIRNYVKWTHTQVTPRGCLLMLVFLLLVAAVAMIGKKDTPSTATPTVGAPTATTPRPNPPMKKPTPRPASKPAPTGTSTAGYDARGLVDGGIPGAPPGWKPVDVPPPPAP